LLRFDEREEMYYDIGTLVLIHDDSEIEVIVTGKDELSELEHGALLRQIEHLAGRAVWTYSDDEPQKGWFIRGAFRK
jgi:chaperonin cofactor prefoldin